jgi:hypothetical protein
LLSFLDGFIDVSAQKERDVKLCEELLANQSEIERLHQEVSRIPDIERAKKVADDQLATLKKQKVAEVVELEQKLANEKLFRDRLRTNLSSLLSSINDGLNSDDITELIDGMEGTNLVVGKAEFDAVQKLVKGLAGEVNKLSEQLKAKVKGVTDQVNGQLTAWAAKEKETRDKIEDLRRELEKQKIPLDIAFIRKVTKDATDYAVKLADLKKLVPRKDAAHKRRDELMSERRDLKNKIFATRQGFATLMNKNLATALVDYNVNVKFVEGVLSKQLEELVKEAMGWRTSQVPKAALIASHFSPITLIDAVHKEDTASIANILDANKNKVFSTRDAEEILAKLNEWQHYFAIQRCSFEDKPEIRVTKAIEGVGGKKSYVVREFGKLSLGQQQSILLSILLFSKSTAPLIIDQPEDNLDSEFIYTALVRSLRSIKEHRQVAIVTHNANIAVLGDAELIVPLRGASEVSVIRDRGSIDNTTTRDLVCTILEGSKKAFRRRAEVYGH